MTSCVNIAPEQLCYIPCNFCNFVLAVNVPCNNMFDIVTVLCGHCKNLWSVNMASAFQSRSWQDPQAQIYSSKPPNRCRIDSGSSSNCNNKMTLRPQTKNSNSAERLANQTPEKRKRVPSAYNQFIKEEIQRIKANNPDISHREAFTTAAKNWAHFPHIHYSLWSDASNKQPCQG